MDRPDLPIWLVDGRRGNGQYALAVAARTGRLYAVHHGYFAHRAERP